MEIVPEARNRNFDASVAEQFAREVVKRTGLVASNMSEFLEKVLEFSQETRAQSLPCWRWQTNQNIARMSTLKLRRSISTFA